MGAASDYLENKLLDHIFRTADYTPPTNIYVALCKSTIDDTHTGSTLPGEVSGGGYERTLCNDWSPATAGVSNNENTVLFPKSSADWGRVSNIALCDSQTTGNVLTYGRLYDYKDVVTDDQMEFEAGGLTVTIDETISGTLVLVHGHSEALSSATGYASGDAYWASPTGTATWANARSVAPLSGAACCSLATANANAQAGDTVYFRGGTYAESGVYQEGFKPSGTGTDAAHRLIFIAYGAEVPIIDGSSTTLSWGLAIVGKSFIKIDGFHIKNWDRWADIRAGSHYNEITNCEFYSDTGEDGWAGLRIIEDCVGGASYLCPCTHNWVHGNTFHTLHSAEGILKEGADLIRIGQSNDTGDSEFGNDNNTIEDNVIYHAGHTCFDGYGLYTVFKNNVLHNEPWWNDDSIGKTTTLTGTVDASATTLNVVSTASMAQADFSDGYLLVGTERIYYGGRTATSFTSCTRGISGTSAASHLSGSTVSCYARYRSDMYTDETLRNKFGHRVFQITDGGKRDGIYSLIEGNRFGYGGCNPNNNGADCLDIAGPKNIIRFNSIYGSMNSGIMFKYGWVETAGGHGGTYNKVYNNTVYHCGYGNPRYELTDSGVSTSPEALLAVRFYQTETYGNVLKNNLIYDSRRYALSGFEIGGGATDSSVPTGTVLDTNWLTSDGDPLFTNPSLSDYSSTTLPDLSLQAGSGAIGAGTSLTLASGSGSGSTTLVVDDARYFQDGTWGSALTHGVTLFPDWIAIGAVGNVVAISFINYTTNTITLASVMTWADDAPIWLYKNSSGVRVLYGVAPDYGACPKVG